MSRIALEDFGDKDVSRIYLAGRLAEAKRVEEVLTDNNIDYAVEVEPYLAFVLFDFSEYGGAAFYVATGQAEFCRGILSFAGILKEAGLAVGILEEDEPQE